MKALTLLLLVTAAITSRAQDDSIPIPPLPPDYIEGWSNLHQEISRVNCTTSDVNESLIPKIQEFLVHNKSEITNDQLYTFAKAMIATRSFTCLEFIMRNLSINADMVHINGEVYPETSFMPFYHYLEIQLKRDAEWLKEAYVGLVLSESAFEDCSLTEYESYLIGTLLPLTSLGDLDISATRVRDDCRKTRLKIVLNAPQNPRPFINAINLEFKY